jgi:hypothetical protein
MEKELDILGMEEIEMENTSVDDIDNLYSIKSLPFYITIVMSSLKY